MRDRVGPYELFIAIDCKDYKKAVNVQGVGQFISLARDVGANKGVMVSAKGFSPTARTLARKAGIQLYTPVSASGHEWKVLVTVPALCEVRYVRGFSY